MFAVSTGQLENDVENTVCRIAKFADSLDLVPGGVARFAGLVELIHYFSEQADKHVRCYRAGKEMLSEMSMLIQKIKPIDPRVCLIYTKALDSSKLVTRCSLGAAFIRSLHYGYHSCEGSIARVIEGLKFLRIKLFGLKQPHIFDVKMKEDIRNLMCDAGVFILPLYQPHVLLDLEKQSSDADLNAKSHAQSIQNELIRLKSFLGETVELQSNDQEEIQALWHRVLEVAFKVENIINYLMVGDLPYYASTLSHSITKDISNIWTEVQVKAPGIKLKREGIKVKEVAMTNRHVPSATPSPSVRNQVVGSIMRQTQLLIGSREGRRNCRILLTTRNHEVAELDEKPHKLRSLNEEESLELFRMKSSTASAESPALDRNLWRQVFQICNGLPLIIVVVSGLLKSTEPKEWNKVLESLTSSNVLESCKDILELSYKQCIVVGLVRISRLQFKHSHVKIETSLPEGPGLGYLPIENLDNSCYLYELVRVSGVILPPDWRMEEVMNMFPNIRKLKSRIQGFDDNHAGKLVQIAAPVSLWLRSWNASDDQVMCLEDLELCDCLFLKEMPSCLGTLETLQMIKVIHCPVVVETLVTTIKELQVEFGNSDLKVIIQSRRSSHSTMFSRLLWFRSDSKTGYLVTRIDFALHNVELMFHRYGKLSMLWHMRFMLRNLKIFVLCARKLNGIDNIVHRIAKFTDTFHIKSHDKAKKFEGPVKEIVNYFIDQANGWYITLFDATRKSSSFTADEILEIICCFQQILEEYQSYSYHSLQEAMNALGEQMDFLKSFILFATRDVVESKGNVLLAHAGSITIDAAYLLLKDGAYKYDGELYSSCRNIPENVKEEMMIKISTLIRKIKPVDPCVCKIYTKVLNRSKLASRLLCAEKSINILSASKKFFSSLSCLLWDLLALGPHIAILIPVKDRLQELYEGLRLLRIRLFGQKQQDIFDAKMKEDIRDVMCDAGVFIFAIYQTNVQLDLEFLQSLLRAIKVILAKFGEEGSKPRVPKSSTQVAFLDFLLEKLMELTIREASLQAKSHAHTIRNELIHLRSLLADTVELQNNDQEEIQALWGRVLEVAFKVEDAINFHIVGDHPRYVSTLFHSILIDIRNILPEIEVTAQEMKLKIEEIKGQEVTAMTNSRVRSTTTPPSLANHQVVGFHQEAKSVIHRLTRGAKKLQVVSIVGRPGIGKTTLAEKVYNDPCISYHFSACALTTVSQTIDRKRVLLELLKQVAPGIDSTITSKMTADDAANQPWRSLKRKRYFIILDDIWEAKAWHCLQQAFPDDSMGSRILLTSRSYEVAPLNMLDEKPHELRPLNEEESLELFRMKLSSGSAESPALGNLGRKIVQICNGLPLKIVIVAGLLKSTAPREWNKVLESLSSGNNISESCKDTLELSYRHLPGHLKPCLLYLATFREDQQVSVKTLLYIWMAEGFIRKVEMKRLLDVAEEYLNDLIGRSLVMVTKKKSTGGMSTCRIHDLLHEFCSQKVQDEQFFHFLEGEREELSTLKEPRYLWRLCINSASEHVLDSKVYWYRVRTLRVSLNNKPMKTKISVMFRIWKFLRVLNLEETELSVELPSEIGLLVLLAFFAVRGHSFSIPTSLGDLSNLETLIISDLSAERFSLPDTFWNLQKLKHLYMKGRALGILPIENLDNSCFSCELDRISGVILPHDDWRMKEVMNVFPNIRKLKCKIQSFDNHAERLVQIAAPVSLRQLKSLDMSVDYNKLPERIMFELSFPANLEKLSLSGIPLSKKCLSGIGKLPNLGVLKLDGTDFEGDTWTMEEEEFSKLRILKLKSKWLRSWDACEDHQLGCLEELELRSCTRLIEMPSCLETLPMLQMIEVIHCHRNVESFMKQIEEVLVDFGNPNLKVVIQSWRR
ncbi:OLC1v1006593C1 [Oldenlandia corymbosa var. corymbosa]|uniref:OLC1v1006593C1 n=1 Tax=Oldenlandia corymbosa var. corymbosa TaxID=529605 RepID=A0AAV1DK02_OLDCO|nr:OLC1v1006593C1 [Oldenlandia corymbosa var. corymbosa]